MTADGRKTLEGRITVPRGQVLPVHAHMIPTYPRGTAWTQAVIGAAFVGAGIYLGLESNRLHDELVADRRAGVLEAGDGRVALGRWFAVGSNVGFALGGVFAALSTYNFIKDPLPESSKQESQAEEFADPRNQRPTAPAPGARVEPRRQGDLAERGGTRQSSRGATIVIAPQLGTAGGGISIGGTF